jgi:hypothetical protein
MSDDTKTVKDHMVGALGGAFKGISDDLNEDGMIVQGLTTTGLPALGAAVQGWGAISLAVAAGSAPAVVTALLPALAFVGVGAGIGVVFAAGKGVGNYLEANQKRKS